MPTTIDFATVIPKFDAILERGLITCGMGYRDGQMSLEAAICAALDLPHSDDPLCVAPAVRSYAITLNSSPWSSPEATAKGLRELGIGQLGSKSVVDDNVFTDRLAKLTIRQLIPTLFREIFPNNSGCLGAALLCENEGSLEAVRATMVVAKEVRETAKAKSAINAAEAARRAASKVMEPNGEKASWSAIAARRATEASTSDKYLLLSAKLALQVLRELNSPGCAWLEK
jgi:hypothetical protein